MYSPRIAKRLIPRIFRAARAAGVPMTIWVQNAVEVALERAERTVVSNGHARHPSKPDDMKKGA